MIATGIQVIGVIFGLIMIYLSYIYLKKKQFDGIDFLFWMTIWICFIIAIVFPDSLNLFVEGFGVVRAMDLLMIIAFIGSFSLLFFVYRKTKENSKRLARLIEGIALKEFEKGIQ